MAPDRGAGILLIPGSARCYPGCDGVARLPPARIRAAGFIGRQSEPHRDSRRFGYEYDFVDDGYHRAATEAEISTVRGGTQPTAEALGIGQLTAFTSTHHTLSVASCTTVGDRTASVGAFGMVFVSEQARTHPFVVPRERPSIRTRADFVSRNRILDGASDLRQIIPGCLSSSGIRLCGTGCNHCVTAACQGSTGRLSYRRGGPGAVC